MSVRIRPGDDPANAGTSISATALVADDDSVVDPDDIRGFWAEAAAEDPDPAWAADGLRERLPRVPQVIAGVLLAVVAMLLLGGLAFRLSVPAAAPGADPAAPATQPSAPASPSASASASASTSPSPSSDVGAVGSRITAVPWQGAALPVSEVDGPAVFTKTRSTGFSRSPQGAALAAVHISTHLDPYTGPAVFTATITEQVVGGGELLTNTTAQYRAAAQAQGLSSDAISDGKPVLAPTGSIDAWRIAAYRPDATTTVELLVSTPQGDDVVYEVPVVWQADDWRVTFAGRDPVFVTASPKGRDGFTPFVSS